MPAAELGLMNSRVLTPCEREALQELSRDHVTFFFSGHFARRISVEALEVLAGLGLVERAPMSDVRGQSGWRILPDGWRCMYGKTVDQIMSGDQTVLPLRVWQWPPL
jgi:hypothetical protein